MNKIISLLIILLFSGAAFAGDYMLTISDDFYATCTERVRKIHDWCKEERNKGNECKSEVSWPLKTSDEVIESLNQYFTGEKPKINILIASFSNGHLDFCSKKEKMKIYHALLDIKASGEANNKRHLEDFINILGVKDNK